jgi:hypothetical protein
VRFDGAVVNEQGVTFGIIIVKPSVLRDATERSNMRVFGVRAFGRMPIMLMSQDSRGTPTYQGRRDIAKFLSQIRISRIPWKNYTIS